MVDTASILSSYNSTGNSQSKFIKVVATKCSERIVADYEEGKIKYSLDTSVFIEIERFYTGSNLKMLQDFIEAKLKSKEILVSKLGIEELQKKGSGEYFCKLLKSYPESIIESKNMPGMQEKRTEVRNIIPVFNPEVIHCQVEALSFGSLFLMNRSALKISVSL